ncbi:MULTISPECIES: peptidase [Streptomyces]|uniref:Peptidase n=1 Tax=Streptomyces glycanivorans TaxID=3033808 RepID=A0ABY9JF54_9ACTN|nr:MULTISPECIES: peptidase [unclassified Streptomyces]WLQ64636.1 peptidase [Streptomyces sp. Alt3]WSQ78018.1 peptidase [Streptomyces sp. NBC_01213]WSQ85391.1 peptidase [Streptomyces sp. NBC_01212]
MTRLSPRTVLCRTAGGLAVVGLLAAGSPAVGAPAPADDPAFTLGGPAPTALHPYPETGNPERTALGFTVHDPDEEGTGYEGEVTYTFDLSGIEGVAELLPAEDTGADCVITGTTAVCHDHGVRAGLSSVAEFGIVAARGSEDGASGTIEVTGSADGATFTPFSAEVTVGGPDLVMKQLPFEQQLRPGDVQPAPITFTNQGTRAADGVLLTLRYSRGLEIPERYANCEYDGEAGDEPFEDFVWATALCSVPGSFEPGATYTLGAPLSVEATERAYQDTFVYRIEEDSGALRPARRTGAPLTRGTGPELTMEKVTTSARTADLDPWDNQQEADFRTENTANFVAVGGKADGAVGDTVTADVGFRNDGPAWIGHIRSGEPVATLDFTVPEGTEVTGKPDSCQGVTAEGTYREDRTPAPRYVCDTSMTVRDGAEASFPFELKITDVVPGAEGAVRIRNTWLDGPALPFDPEPADNTARLVLNGADPGSEDTGGTSTSGGTTGTGGSTEGVAGGDTTGGEGQTPGTAGTSSGPGSTGTTGTTGSASQNTGGGLASTGSVAIVAGAAATIALVAGGVLHATTRRRSRLI